MLAEAAEYVVLNADELGEKGQARFKEICADAKLVCNAADRDRTGWDFIVEFPFETETGGLGALDARKAPVSCHVQVKTILEGTDRISMRLSSAERLAKELKPSFVYVLKLDADLNFKEAYLIHLLGDPLAAVLKRLRREDVAGNLATNRKMISLKVSKFGIRVPPTGSRLRDAVKSLCGGDLFSYAKKKSEQLSRLGRRPPTKE